ncbi:DUF3501 family protein [Candidatus Marithrix sp. Canyon 246]|uniref:DUF3501 family protein n=1 Tax=Candidatus Marithrix sp. Canyon 246 TaxID=1827136 RepID=UPI000849FF2C|nr:DUF3501 family protein [Candidatus Marithrix sp. Canyon 246]
MQKLTRSDLYSLEQYAEKRAEFRAQVMAHKKNRRVPIGNHATLYFEDRLTMQYQIQEMLRVERIFEPAGIEEELAAYNPLIPDGDNWKATFMIEYSDVAERQAALAKLVEIENQVWIEIADTDRIYAIADEDLDRTTSDKTSAVHFLRFQLNAEQIAAVKANAEIGVGIDHVNYKFENKPVADNIREALAADIL